MSREHGSKVSIHKSPNHMRGHKGLGDGTGAGGWLVDLATMCGTG